MLFPLFLSSKEKLILYISEYLKIHVSSLEIKNIYKFKKNNKKESLQFSKKIINFEKYEGI